jgi:hypothetical protein
MNSNSSSETDAAALLALRANNDAVRVITERLRVKEMGPADHIRTKHEVKLFVNFGDVKEAEALVKRAVERRAANEAITVNQTQRQGLRPHL